MPNAKAKDVPVAERNTAPTRGQKAGQQVTLALRARCAGFWVVSKDEARTESDLIPAIAKAGYRPRLWDISNGAVDIDGSPVRGNPDYNAPEGPDEILKLIEDRSKARLPETESDRNVWILRDLGPWLEGAAGAVTLRKLRNMLRPDGLSGTARNVAQAIILLSPGDSPPPALSNGELDVINWPLPDRDEINEILESQISVLPDTEKNPLKSRVKEALAQGRVRDSAVDAAVGLSSLEIQTTFARSLIEGGKIDVAAISAEKRRLINREPALTYYEPRPGGFDSVGGLDLFKEAMAQTRVTFTPEARAYGLKLAKGVVLLGVSGCGKTLTCQALGSEWGWPVIRLDINALKGKYVGESESRLRSIFALIDALGQCVVYVDEVEKALQGATSGASDGGVSSDALGAILTWMQDRSGQAFVMMTANDPSALPPEFLRKGRFDDIWFVDLPTRSERASITAATLRSNGRDATKLGIDLLAVADATSGFNGAEIASAIEGDAMFTAFADGAREVTTDDILLAASKIIPLSRTSAEKIEALRNAWAGRARPTTRPDAGTPQAKKAARALDF